MAGYDFTGKTMGKLTALSIAKQDSSGHNYWLCQCECGNQIVVRSTELVNGKTTMCNSCKRKNMGYTNDIQNKSIKTISQNEDNWLDANNISYKNIDDYDNVFNMVELYDENISILSSPVICKIVHCINADLTYGEKTYIGNGKFEESLAKQIDDFFCIRKQLDDLSNIEWEVGEVIYTAPVYHLLTKKDKNSFVSYDNLYICLMKLYEKAKNDGNYYLAFPRICCGKDKLDWDIVLQMILHIFGDEFNILLF